MARDFMCTKTEPVVQTKAGKLRGFRIDGVYAFHGVKYADAKRFQQPEPVQPWEGIKNALAYGYVCPMLKQDEPNNELMVPHRYWPLDENCQYLNIWTKSLDPSAKKPVLVWLHGGGFAAGSSIEHIAYEGENMSRYGDVVVVSLNHRLNILGYLDLSPFGEKYANSGNAGSADMVAALQWIHDNIAGFGGDPDNITAAGQSAGCMSVQILISSPLTKGMIRRAILQSGGGLNGLSRDFSQESREAVSKKLMEALGASTIEEMRASPGDKIAEVQYTIRAEDGLCWTPVVDGVLLTAPVDDVARAGGAHDIDYMIGSTGDDIGADTRRLEYSAVYWAKNQLALGRRPAYLYFFDRKLPGDDAGAFHSAELWYEFHTLDRAWRPWEPCDRVLEKAVSTYWANFARCGDQNGAGLPHWRPYTADAPVQMRLAETIGEEAAIVAEG